MKSYVGVREIEASPCVLKEFVHKYRAEGTQVKNPDREGYVLMYPETGYVTWMDKEAFERMYVEVPLKSQKWICARTKSYLRGAADYACTVS